MAELVSEFPVTIVNHELEFTKEVRDDIPSMKEDYIVEDMVLKLLLRSLSLKE